MSGKLRDHFERAPSQRIHDVRAEVVFFPGEVARLLGLTDIDYSQLRRLFLLARVLRGDPAPPRAWSCFTVADLASTEVLVGLGGGRERLAQGRRLTFVNLEATCLALRDMGFDNPLLQVPLARNGRRILARVDSYIFEPSSGQMMLDQTGVLIDRFLEQRIIEDREVRSAIRRERRRLRPSRPKQLFLDNVSAPLDVSRDVS